MAECRTRTVRMDAIYNVVKNLLQNPDSGVTTPEGVVQWFNQNFPDITTEEIIDSMVVTSPKAVDEAKKNLNKGLSEFRKWAKNLDRMTMFLQNTLDSHEQTGTRERPQPSPEKQQIDSIIARFKELAASDEELTDADIDSVMDMVDALPVNGGYNPDTIRTVVNNLKALKNKKQEKRDQQKVQRLSQKLDELMKGNNPTKARKPRVSSNEHLQEFGSIMKDMQRMAATSPTISDMEAQEIMERLKEVEENYQDYFETDGEISVDKIKRAIQTLREIRTKTQADRLTAKIEETKKNIKALDDPNSQEYVDILAKHAPNTQKQDITANMRENFRLEAELDDLRELYQAKIEAQLRKKRAESVKTILGFEKLFGFEVQGKGVQGMLRLYFALKDYGWETFRTLAFMLDNSAYFVQLSMITTIDITRLPYDALMRVFDPTVDVFAGLNRAALVWNQGFWQVVKSDFEASRGPGQRGVFSKSSKGEWSRQMYNDLIKDEHYGLMEESGLKISRSRSLSDSEEYFKTSLLNQLDIKGFSVGWFKDVSEDVMVTTLNMYRALLFKDFVKRHPDLTPEEYKKVAEGINNITGTTNERGNILAPLSIVLSAPRLLYAKLKLALKYPAMLITALDVKKSVMERSIKYNSAYSAYMARQTAGMFASWMMIGFAVAAMGGRFSADPEDPDFMRISFGNNRYDITGGIGAIYRTIALMTLLASGYEGSTQKSKDRLGYLRNVKKMNVIDPALQFARNKLHPAVSSLTGIATGKDFMDNPYAQDPGVSRAIAAGMSLLPITIQQAYDDYAKVQEEQGGSFGEILAAIATDPEFYANFALQWHGINVYEKPETANIKVEKTLERLEYRPDVRYPGPLKGDDYEESNRKAYLKRLYKQKWQDALGEFLKQNPDVTQSELKSRLSGVRSKLDREFMARYKEDLAKLEKSTK